MKNDLLVSDFKNQFDKVYFDEKGKNLYIKYDRETFYPSSLQLARYLKTKYDPVKVLEIGCAKGVFC